MFTAGAYLFCLSATKAAVIVEVIVVPVMTRSPYSTHTHFFSLILSLPCTMYTLPLINELEVNVCVCVCALVVFSSLTLIFSVPSFTRQSIWFFLYFYFYLAKLSMSKTVQVQIENNSWYLAQYSVFHDFYFSVCVPARKITQ